MTNVVMASRLVLPPISAFLGRRSRACHVGQSRVFAAEHIHQVEYDKGEQQK